MTANAYVTLVTNHDYADAAIALVRSLVLTGTAADIVVMHTGAVDVADLEPLKALGARCVLFSGGHHGRAHLAGLGAPVVDDLRAIPGLVAGG